MADPSPLAPSPDDRPQRISKEGSKDKLTKEHATQESHMEDSKKEPQKAKNEKREAVAKKRKVEDTQPSAEDDHSRRGAKEAGALLAGASTTAISKRDAWNGGSPPDSLKSVYLGTMAGHRNLKSRPEKPKTVVGDNNQIDAEKWSLKDWKDFAALFALFAILMDPSQSVMLMQDARSGVHFMTLYLILVTVIQLPLLLLYSHIGHYHRVGLTNAFSLYGPIYRAIGIIALVIMPFRYGLGTYNIAGGLVNSVSYGTNLTSLVSCVDSPISCYEEFKNRDTCCYSLYDAWICEKMTSKPHWCDHMTKITSNHKSASSMYISGFAKDMQGMRALPIVGVIILVVTAALVMVSRSHPFIFAAFVAVIGIIGFILCLFKCGMQLISGDFSTGFMRMFQQTQIMQLSQEAVINCIKIIIWSGPSKISFVSIASMISEKKRLYFAIMVMHVIHVFLTLFHFFGYIASVGALETLSQKLGVSSSVASTITGTHLQLGVIPEFLSVSGMEVWYIILYINAFIVQFGPFCGPFFDIITSAKDRKWLFFSGCCFIVTIQCIAFSVANFVPQTQPVLESTTVIMFSMLILLVVETTVRLYGLNEHIVDVCAMYPLRSACADRISPASKFYTWCLCYIVSPVMIAFFILKIRHLFTVQLDILNKSICFSLFAVAILTFVVFFINDFISLRRKNLPSWRLFLPTKGHMAYCRFFKGEKDIFEIVQAEKDKEVTADDVSEVDQTKAELSNKGDKSAKEASQSESKSGFSSKKDDKSSQKTSQK